MQSPCPQSSCTVLPMGLFMHHISTPPPAVQPYLHTSRHNHAARRVRGAGGRFLTSDEARAYREQATPQSQATDTMNQSMFTSDTATTLDDDGTSRPRHDGRRGFQLDEADSARAEASPACEPEHAHLRQMQGQCQDLRENGVLTYTCFQVICVWPCKQHMTQGGLVSAKYGQADASFILAVT